MPARDEWDNDPEHPVQDWQAEVVNGDTRQGYADWIAGRIAAQAAAGAGLATGVHGGTAAGPDESGQAADRRDEASPEVREKIKAALQAGRVTFAPGVEEAISRIKFDGSPPDFSLVDVSFTFWGPHDNNNGGLGINWSTVSAGCGRCDFYLDKQTNELRCMNEAMSKQFIHFLLERMLEQTVLDG